MGRGSKLRVPELCKGCSHYSRRYMLCRGYGIGILKGGELVRCPHYSERGVGVDADGIAGS